ncbi:MAG TPA: DUF4340 domain-containing protein [Anaerolineales bacterium]|nr:DUF4340 domain-containing protein [Anaerolineales bacterium]
MLRKNTLVLVVVFLVLVAGFYLFQRYKEQNPTVPTSDSPTVPPPVYLFEFTSDAVVGMVIEGTDGQVVELQKDADGTWQMLQPPTLPEAVNQTPISSAISQIGTLRVLNELTVAPALDAIGLDQPATSITLTLDTGETVKMDVGASSPTGSGYYVRVNGGSPKLVDKYVLDQFTGFLTAPPLLPTPVLTDTLSITPTLDLSTPVP